VFKVSRRKITVEKDLFRPSRLLSYLIQSRALKPIHSFFFQVTTVSGQSSSGIHVSWSRGIEFGMVGKNVHVHVKLSCRNLAKDAESLGKPLICSSCVSSFELLDDVNF